MKKNKTIYNLYYGLGIFGFILLIGSAITFTFIPDQFWLFASAFVGAMFIMQSSHGMISWATQSHQRG